jgi:SDR family mycofactocin-dependent oxidoreductase
MKQREKKMGKLDGKVALVTGAARGQGRSHAVELAKEGADIIAIDLCRQIESVPFPMGTEKDLLKTVSQVQALGRQIVASKADIRDLAELREAVDTGVAELGRLDIVVANAGTTTPGPSIGMDEGVWDDTIEVNLTGQWKTVEVAVPHIVATGDGGSIVLTSSTAALRGFANLGPYSAAKAGLVAFMKVLAIELAPHRIRVNTIHPATVATEMILNNAMYKLFRPDLDNPTREDFEAVARTKTKLSIVALDSIDISNGVLFLVTDSGRFITGTSLVIDPGGLL